MLPTGRDGTGGFGFDAAAALVCELPELFDFADPPDVTVESGAPSAESPEAFFTGRLGITGLERSGRAGFAFKTGEVFGDFAPPVAAVSAFKSGFESDSFFVGRGGRGGMDGFSAAAMLVVARSSSCPAGTRFSSKLAAASPACCSTGVVTSSLCGPDTVV